MLTPIAIGKCLGTVVTFTSTTRGPTGSWLGRDHERNLNDQPARCECVAGALPFAAVPSAAVAQNNSGRRGTFVSVTPLHTLAAPGVGVRIRVRCQVRRYVHRSPSGAASVAVTVRVGAAPTRAATVEGHCSGRAFRAAQLRVVAVPTPSYWSGRLPHIGSNGRSLRFRTTCPRMHPHRATYDSHGIVARDVIGGSGWTSSSTDATN